MVPCRGANYTCDEDRLLCNVYISISKDPNMTANQRKDHFWACVTTTYNSSKPSTVMQDRNKRSVQCRIQTIQQAVSKLNKCMQQIECRKENGASELDILNQAKQLMQQDAKFRVGFKFDHVWTIMKDVAHIAAPKKQRHVSQCSLFPVNSVPESPISPPPRSSSFAPYESDENVSGGSSSQESKESKRRSDEDVSVFVKVIQEENQKLRDLLTSKDEKAQQIFDVQKRKLEFDQWKEENKILRMNLETISDSRRREFFREEQHAIMEKRYAAKREKCGRQE